MSGHSKWNTIKRQKGAADAKRSAAFTKYGRLITLAAKEMGGDIATNFKLRLAVDQARSVNMPKDTIERAIKRGTGEIEGGQIFEMIYEGYGPGGIAIVIEALTDNKNRTASSVKHILSKFGGSLGAPNSVVWMFDKKGVIRIDAAKLSGADLDEVELSFIDAGADDVERGKEYWTIITDQTKIQTVKEEVGKKLKELGGEEATIDYAELEWIAKDELPAPTDSAATLNRLLEALDEDEDVNNYFTNAQEEADNQA